MKKSFMLFLSVFVLFAGCASGPIIQEKPSMGRLVLLVSDEEANIGDFSMVNVTFSSARVFSGDSNNGFKEIPLSEFQVDLFKLIGQNAFPIGGLELETGKYSKIELHVSSVEAVLISGEPVEVKIPSEQLQITKPFTIEANTETKFLFDIEVVKKGQKYEYNLMPNIAKSGVVGKDVPETEVRVVKEAKPEKKPEN
ncbi:MAG: DUF4382 domain-containing protein [Candidatus Diapherotrites archaeon]